MKRRTQKKSSEDNSFNESNIEGQSEKEIISKKLFLSTENTKNKTNEIVEKKYIPYSTKKEPVKQLSIKDLLDLKKKQSQIMLSIENENIQKHVTGLLEKFNAPNCQTCSKRAANRICINKKCGKEKYMQLICGKCHFTEHTKSDTKPEIDIEEYFIKLSVFMNEQKQKDSENKKEKLDLEKLGQAFEEVELIRQDLQNCRSFVESLINEEQSPQQMQTSVSEIISLALSQCEYDNIQEQLNRLKKNVIFRKNNFQWNDISVKSEQSSKIFKQLEKQAQSVINTVLSSFTCGIMLNLNEYKLIPSTLNEDNGNSYIQPILPKNDEIQLVHGQEYDNQFYLNYELELNSRYSVRFRCQMHSQNSYFALGFMPISKQGTNYLNEFNKQCFQKWSQYYGQCQFSEVVKGNQFQQAAQKDQQIEMRVDFKNNYIDFYDYPEMKNINVLRSIAFTAEKNVLTIYCTEQISLYIERIEEIPPFEMY